MLCRLLHFSENLFRFFIEFDPTSLIETDTCGELPLHQKVLNFRIVFEYGIRYYPYKIGIGLLFKKNSRGVTPFQNSCSIFKPNKVIEVVEEVLTIYDGITPLNTIEALTLAATNENLHLDCVFFLLSREPNVLIRLSSPSGGFMGVEERNVDFDDNDNTNDNCNSGDTNPNINNEDDDDVYGNNENTKKRKRDI